MGFCPTDPQPNIFKRRHMAIIELATGDDRPPVDSPAPQSRLPSIHVPDDRPHEVHMVFFYRSGCFVQLLHSDAKTPLRRKFKFKDPEKIREIASRGGALDRTPRMNGRSLRARSTKGGAGESCTLRRRSTGSCAKWPCTPGTVICLRPCPTSPQ